MPFKTIHFSSFSIVNGAVKVDVNLDRLSSQFEDAQRWLGSTILEDCKPYMPIRTGSMIQRSHVTDNGRLIVFPGPYARFQYGGLVMIDPVTRSPWARPGAKKILTDRPLKYGSPTATSHWFDTAKANHGDYWIAELKRRAGGR